MSSFIPPLELTQRALADLRDIERYSLETWGRPTADKYLDELEAALDRIQADPDILRLEPQLSAGLYFYRVKKHVLVCDVHGKQVTVLAVIHTSMDLPARLLELEPRIAAESQLIRGKLRRKGD